MTRHLRLTEIDALLERVKAATGPDRDIDALVWCYLNSKKFIGAFESYGGGTQAEYTEPPKRTRQVSRTGEVIEASRSIDAALALVERVFPGLCPGMGKNVHHLYWHAWLGDTDRDGAPREVASGHSDYSAPLAILAALLTALSNRGEHHD